MFDRGQHGPLRLLRVDADGAGDGRVGDRATLHAIGEAPALAQVGDGRDDLPDHLRRARDRRLEHWANQPIDRRVVVDCRHPAPGGVLPAVRVADDGDGLDQTQEALEVAQNPRRVGGRGDGVGQLADEGNDDVPRRQGLQVALERDQRPIRLGDAVQFDRRLRGERLLQPLHVLGHRQGEDAGHHLRPERLDRRRHQQGRTRFADLAGDELAGFGVALGDLVVQAVILQEVAHRARGRIIFAGGQAVGLREDQDAVPEVGGVVDQGAGRTSVDHVVGVLGKEREDDGERVALAGGRRSQEQEMPRHRAPPHCQQPGRDAQVADQRRRDLAAVADPRDLPFDQR